MTSNNLTRKIIVLNIYLLISVLLSKVIIPLTLNTLFSDTSFSFFTTSFIGQIFGFAIPLFLILMFAKKESNTKIKKENLFTLPNETIKSKRSVSFILLTFVLYFFVKTLTNSINSFLYYYNPSENLLLNPEYPNFTSFFVIIVIVAIIPAIIEEITYRGLYYDTYKDNKIVFVVVSTLVFVLSHRNYISLLTALSLSLYLSFVIINTNSIKTAISIHLLFNVISLTCSNYIFLPLSLESAVRLEYSLTNILGLGFINIGLGLLFLLALVILCKTILTKTKTTSVEVVEEEISIPQKQDYILSIVLILIAISIFIYYLLI